MNYTGTVRHDKLSAASGPVDVVVPGVGGMLDREPAPAVMRHGTTTLYSIRQLGLTRHLYPAVAPADAQQFVLGDHEVGKALPSHVQHPAVTANAMLPALRVWQDGVEQVPTDWSFDIESTPSNYERAFDLSCRVGALHVRIRQRVRTLDPLVELDGVCFTMDGAFGGANLNGARFRIDLGWCIPWTIDHAQALGLVDVMPRVDEHGFLWRTLCADALLVHGQQWAAWGVLLATDATTTQRDWLRMAERVTRERPAIGIADWSGHYAPFGGIPMADMRAKANDESHLRSAAGRMLERASYFDVRALGLAPYTGQTGGQDDFGACKGYGALAHQETAWVSLLRTEVSEPLRPIHYLEADGGPIVVDKHPDWWTWSQTTHTNRSASPDRLGMESGRLGATNRWSGKDESHMSSNRLHLLHRLTGSWLTASWIADEAVVGVKQVRARPGQGCGPVRSIGRRMHQLVLAYLDHTRTQRQPLADRLAERLNVEVQLAWNNSAGVALLDNPSLTVRILGQPYVDARKLVDPSTQQPRPPWVAWEHGLALLGMCSLHALHAQQPVLTAANAERLATLVGMAATTLMEHAVWLDGLGECHYAQDIAYDDGKPLPSAAYVPTPDASLVRGIDRSFHDWMAGAVGYCVRTNMLTTDTARLHAQAFLAALDGWRNAASRFRRRDAEAEWAATHA